MAKRLPRVKFSLRTVFSLFLIMSIIFFIITSFERTQSEDLKQSTIRPLLGVAADLPLVDEEQAIISTYGFSWITPENSMKMETIGGCGSYNFSKSDALIKYAKNAQLTVHGHTVLWYKQTSPCAKEFTREQFEEYIRTVVTHYCGSIYSLDIVNEALDEEGGLRDTLWLQKFGPAYIEIAYQVARDACPSMKLYYNDYGLEHTRKAADLFSYIITPLKRKHLLDGIGFQTHLTIHDDPEDLTDTMDRVKDTGLEIALSEVDVRFQKNYQQLIPSDYETQAQIYQTLARICQENTACIRFTVWGIGDQKSWVHDFEQIPDAPLLFDRTYLPKTAYCKGVKPILDTPQGICLQ